MVGFVPTLLVQDMGGERTYWTRLTSCKQVATLSIYIQDLITLGHKL